MIGDFLVTVGIIIFSMVLHELAHGYVAYFLGDTTAKEDGRLTLNPLRHLDPVMSVILPMIMYLMGGVVFGGAKPVPVDSSRLKGGKWGMALVALAGPLTNFLLALIAFLAGNYLESMPGIGGEIVSTVAGSCVLINLGFMVFNLIPIPPLDGSRVIYPLMPDIVQEWMERMERIGIVIVYMLILLGGGVFTGVMSTAIMGILRFFVLLVGG